MSLFFCLCAILMCLLFCSYFPHAWVRSTRAACTSSPLRGFCVCVKLYVSCKLVLWCHTQHIWCKFNRISVVRETYVLLEAIVMFVSVYVMTICSTYAILSEMIILYYPCQFSWVLHSLSPVERILVQHAGFSPNRTHLSRPAVGQINVDASWFSSGRRTAVYAHSTPLPITPCVRMQHIWWLLSVCRVIRILIMSSQLTSWVISEQKRSHSEYFISVIRESFSGDGENHSLIIEGIIPWW